MSAAAETAVPAMLLPRRALEANASANSAATLEMPSLLEHSLSLVIHPSTLFGVGHSLSVVLSARVILLALRSENNKEGHV